MMNLLSRLRLPLLGMLTAWLLQAAMLHAESRQFGSIEVHYSVFTASFLRPEIAAAYGIVRGRDRGVLNIAVRDTTPPGPVEATVRGTRSDLIRKEDLEFREIREDGAIYHIAEFPFVDGETVYFNVSVTPAGATSPLRLEFSQALHAD